MARKEMENTEKHDNKFKHRYSSTIINHEKIWERRMHYINKHVWMLSESGIEPETFSFLGDAFIVELAWLVVGVKADCLTKDLGL